MDSETAELKDVGEKKQKAPSVRRACIACHAGKTRCSEVLPCQSCLKRGLGASCAYPEPEAPSSATTHPAGPAPIVPGSTMTSFAPNIYTNLSNQQFYDYNATLTNASTSTFRANKRPRPLTEEEAAAVTRNFTRGNFYIGNSGVVRIDPRLPVQLTLGEGDLVHFTIGEPPASM